MRPCPRRVPPSTPVRPCPPRAPPVPPVLPCSLWCAPAGTVRPCPPPVRPAGRPRAGRAGARRLVLGPCAGSGGGVMSRQGGGAGAARPAGRRGRCFPALKRQEAERGPASERELEDSELAGTLTAPDPAAGRGHRGAGAHLRAPATPPPRHPARVPGPQPGPPRAHTPLNDISPGRAALSRAGARPRGKRSAFPGDPAGAAAPSARSSRSSSRPSCSSRSPPPPPPPRGCQVPVSQSLPSFHSGLRLQSAGAEKLWGPRRPPAAP